MPLLGCRYRSWAFSQLASQSQRLSFALTIAAALLLLSSACCSTRMRQSPLAASQYARSTWSPSLLMAQPSSQGPFIGAVFSDRGASCSELLGATTQSSPEKLAAQLVAPATSESTGSHATSCHEQLRYALPSRVPPILSDNVTSLTCFCCIRRLAGSVATFLIAVATAAASHVVYSPSRLRSMRWSCAASGPAALRVALLLSSAGVTRVDALAGSCDPRYPQFPCYAGSVYVANSSAYSLYFVQCSTQACISQSSASASHYGSGGTAAGAVVAALAPESSGWNCSSSCSCTTSGAVCLWNSDYSCGSWDGCRGGCASTTYTCARTSRRAALVLRAPQRHRTDRPACPAACTVLPRAVPALRSRRGCCAPHLHRTAAYHARRARPLSHAASVPPAPDACCCCIATGGLRSAWGLRSASPHWFPSLIHSLRVASFPPLRGALSPPRHPPRPLPPLSKANHFDHKIFRSKFDKEI